MVNTSLLFVLLNTLQKVHINEPFDFVQLVISYRLLSVREVVNLGTQNAWIESLKQLEQDVLKHYFLKLLAAEESKPFSVSTTEVSKLHGHVLPAYLLHNLLEFSGHQQ